MQNTKLHKLTMFIVIICAIIMTGCANVTYSHVTFPTGKVEERFIVTLDTKDINNAAKWSGFNTTNLLGIIKTDLDNNFLKDAVDFKNFISTNNSLTAQEKEYINGSILASTEILPYQYKVVSTITFKELEVYILYKKYLRALPVNQNKVYDSLEIIETPLIDYYIQTKNDFVKAALKKYNIQTINTLITQYGNFSNIVTDKKLGTVFNVNELSFTEIWAYPNKNSTSNANNFEVIGDLKYHQWNLNNTLANPVLNTNNDLTLQTISINNVSWYILAACMALLSIIIALIIALFKKPNVYKTKIAFKE